MSRAYDVNWFSGSKFITLGVDDTGFFAVSVFFEGGGKGLGVDNHNVDFSARGEFIEVCEVCAAVDEEACFFMVVFHEVVSSDFE